MPSLHLVILSINQNPIINVELSSFFNIKGPSFIADVFEDIMDVVVYCSHSVRGFLCRWPGKFVVVVEVHGAWIRAIETSVGVEFVGSGGWSIIDKFCER